MKKKGLNERQKGLLTYLINNAKEQFLLGIDIVINNRELYYYNCEEEMKRNWLGSRQQRLLVRDIRDIRKDDETYIQIIEKTSKGYKIATLEEAKETLQRDFNNILKRLKLYHHRIKKLGLEGQLDLLKNEIISLEG